jgi:hypothetical protein
MWPAQAPPGAGSTTALAVLIVQRLPADVRDPVPVADEVAEPVDVLVDGVTVEVVGAGAGAGVGLLHPTRVAIRPAAARPTHPERTDRHPGVVTPR